MRAWHFLNALARVGDVLAYTLTVGADVPDFTFPDGTKCYLSRISPDHFKATSSSEKPISAFDTLISPWARQGRYLILSGKNICESRSNLPTFSVLHWLYGFLLLISYSIWHRLLRLDPSDVHFRGALLDIQVARIKAEFENNTPDILWIEHTYLYSIAEKLQSSFPNIKLAVNAHNVESELKRSIAFSHATWLGKKWGMQESHHLLTMERRMMRDAWFVLSCSEEDRLRFEGLLTSLKQTNARMAVAPNGVDTNYFQSFANEKKNSTETLIFTGTAGYPPNDHAVSWLVNDIWPKIRKSHPHAELILAGRNASIHWKPLIKNSTGITLHSDVADMRSLLSQASLAVVPIQSGSGTRLKILEALSMSLPTVSTSLGAEGLGLQNNTEIVLANGADEFAESVSKLLKDESLRKTLASNGRDRVVEYFDWKSVCNTFLKKFESIWREQIEHDAPARSQMSYVRQ